MPPTGGGPATLTGAVRMGAVRLTHPTAPDQPKGKPMTDFCFGIFILAATALVLAVALLFATLAWHTAKDGPTMRHWGCCAHFCAPVPQIGQKAL